MQKAIAQKTVDDGNSLNEAANKISGSTPKVPISRALVVKFIAT
ncbi:MAG: hypothetical protein AAF892_17840 [Cyanobacteria bacterium P01_D01_bin.71]